MYKREDLTSARHGIARRALAVFLAVCMLVGATGFNFADNYPSLEYDDVHIENGCYLEAKENDSDLGYDDDDLVYQAETDDCDLTHDVDNCDDLAYEVEHEDSDLVYEVEHDHDDSVYEVEHDDDDLVYEKDYDDTLAHQWLYEDIGLPGIDIDPFLLGGVGDTFNPTVGNVHFLYLTIAEYLPIPGVLQGGWQGFIGDVPNPVNSVFRNITGSPLPVSAFTSVAYFDIIPQWGYSLINVLAVNFDDNNNPTAGNSHGASTLTVARYSDHANGIGVGRNFPYYRINFPNNPLTNNFGYIFGALFREFVIETPDIDFLTLVYDYSAADRAQHYARVQNITGIYTPIAPLTMRLVALSDGSSPLPNSFEFVNPFVDTATSTTYPNRSDISQAFAANNRALTNFLDGQLRPVVGLGVGTHTQDVEVLHGPRVVSDFELMVRVLRPATHVEIFNPRNPTGRNADIEFEDMPIVTNTTSHSSSNDTLMYSATSTGNAYSHYHSTVYTNADAHRPSRERDITVTLDLPCVYSFFCMDELTRRDAGDNPIGWYIDVPQGYRIVSVAVANDGDRLIVVLTPVAAPVGRYLLATAVRPTSPRTSR